MRGFITRPLGRVLVAPSSALGAGGMYAASTSSAPRVLNASPLPSQTMTNTVSHLCGFPDTTNAGVPAGATLFRVPEDITAPNAFTGSGWHYESGGLRIDTAGAVIQNISIQGSIDIDSLNNVVVQRCRVQFPGEWFGVNTRHVTNFTLQDSEISGTNSGAGRMLAGFKDIFADSVNLQILRNNIYWVSTGVQMDAGLIEGNYIHDMGFVSGDHINGTTSNQGTTLLTIRGNTVLNDFNQTDAISLFEDFSVQGNRVIDHNLVAGGTYAIYGGQNAGGPTAFNIDITNNQFSRMYYSTCGQFGPYTARAGDGASSFTGNIWDDTGLPVS